MIVIEIEMLLFLAGSLLLLSVLANAALFRFGIPSLLLFLVIGMLAGSDGVGGVYFDNPTITRQLGTLALALILFAGGLDTNIKSAKSVALAGLSLAVVGTLVTATLVGLFAHYLLGLSLLEGLLIGGIVASTDAAAVFGVLRAKALRLRHSLQPLLELESGSNDPTAVFLTVYLTAALVTGTPLTGVLAIDFILQMSVGAGVGIACGYAGALILNRIHIEQEGLYPVITVGLALLTFGGAEIIGGNGFLAVYLCGLSLGAHNFIHKIGLMQFHDGLAWLMQIVMFLVLGLMVFPSQLSDVALYGACIALFLAFIARPVAVFVALAPFRRFTFQDRLFVSWVGLRGAVPIILATIPLTEGLSQSSTIFNVVFFVVLLSVLIQGSTLSTVARWLRVGSAHTSSITERRVASKMIEIRIPGDSPAIGKQLVELPLSQQTLIVLITRGSESYIPRGKTTIEKDDRLLVTVPESERKEVESIFLAAPR